MVAANPLAWSDSSPLPPIQSPPKSSPPPRAAAVHERAMAPPRPPPPLIDDVTAEILLRVPPDEPEHLFRAALVCKPWLRIVCDQGFLRQYRAFHGAPPLLGLLPRLRFIKVDLAPCFASTTSMPEFPYPVSDGPVMQAHDCRHGRVLLRMLDFENKDNFLVCNPATGHRHRLPLPEPAISWQWHRETCSAAVFCAADGCDHLDCRDGHFRVAFVGICDQWNTIWANVYSSEMCKWSEPVSVSIATICDLYVELGRGALIGGEIFITVSQSLSTGISRYDWSKKSLSVMNPPPVHKYNGIVLMAMDGSSLGLAGIKTSSLYLWSTKVNSEGPVGWVQCRVIELETIMPVAMPHQTPRVVGFAEGLDTILVRRVFGFFTINLKSEQVRKLGVSGRNFSVLPYMSFYTPDRGTLLSIARTL